jgi:hypothetical protein
MEASPLYAELPIREPFPMQEDDSDIVIDSSNWIFQWITYAASSNLLIYCKAMSRPDAKQWEITMQEEIKSQMENRTWVLVQRIKNCKVVKCK